MSGLSGGQLVANQSPYSPQTTKHSTVVVVVAVVVVTVLNVPSLSTFHLASVPIMSSAQPGTMQSRAQLAAIHCFNNTDTDITIHLAMEVGEGGSWGDY